ncbi:MAG: DUF721 domain-containing protein [Prevotella sp.]|nr:DUF721 domain-containing protein [Prevotella sp.]
MFRRKVKPFSDILNESLRQWGLEMPLLQKRLIDSWEEVVGEAVGKYTGEKFIKNQTLFVKILNPALRYNLSMSRSRIVLELNKAVGSNVINDIKFY